MNKKELFEKVEKRLHKYKYLDVQIKNLELDIEQIKSDYRGCGAITYDEKTGVTYNINRSVENEIIAKEKKIAKLTKIKIEKEIEKQKIENALTCLDIIETDFFNLFYNSRSKNNMQTISTKMHMDRSYLYTFKENIVYKIMGMLYPTYEDLPLFEEKTTEKQHFNNKKTTN
ncbi:hypothetical protein WS9_003860 [Paraclostridium sordellii 8483]|uniref:hypothetical protein n=1 Tax=Paraclostridium sordellii TaxID=1505 RepID=UPI0002EA3A62|nr:hypothetical protein [Paeniclostridium sordellii]TAN69165.1 hypothetical protein WS9_003860 [Paeniclostridium sordellii 8483]